MALQGWPYTQDPREERFNRFLIISFFLHFAGIAIFLIYPLLFKPKPIKVPILEIVQFEKPKVRLRRPKTIKKPLEKKPVIKKEAPKFTSKPKKALTPEKKKPREVKREPDTTKVRKTVEEVVEEMVPKMVMQEMGGSSVADVVQKGPKKDSIPVESP